MNIVIKPYGSELCYCRPDTTWERENRDLYSPDCVNEWHWTPVLYARISKAGKCINPKFIDRYFDSVNFGALLYIGGADTAFSSCVDHTSILPGPLFNPVVLENEENVFEVKKNNETVFCSKTTSELSNAIKDTICKASMLTSLRIGDMVAVELAPATSLCTKSEGEISLMGTYCENDIFGFKIIF